MSKEQVSREKVPLTMRFSDRQVTYYTAKAKITGNSFAEELRRALDAQIEAEEARKPQERILVLDREKNTLTAAR